MPYGESVLWEENAVIRTKKTGLKSRGIQSRSLGKQAYYRTFYELIIY